ncbi:MAG: hypothetical protein R3F36_09745 [Candidatus Competibacteraceae bacterium]
MLITPAIVALQLIALSAGTVLLAAGFAGRSCATGTSTAAANYS